MGFVNVAYRRAKFFGKVLEARATGRVSPLLVTWALGARCNFRCKYCYGDYENRDQEILSTDEALSLLDELAGMGTQFIQLSGGEPLMFPGIEDVVDRANTHGICLGMSTNGSLIPRKLDVVKKIQTVCVSLDGEAATHDANRGPGTHQRAMEGLQAARAAGVRVHIYCTVTRYNVNSLDRLMEFCRTNRIYAEFGFLVNRAMRNDADYQGIDLDIETFRAAQGKLVEYKEKGYPILFSRQILRRVRDWPDFSVKKWMNTRPPFDHVPCEQGRLMIFIDCDGKVYPCIQMIGEFNALSFKDVGFRAAYARCQEHTCKACYLMCVNDFNLLFHLNPGVIWNNVAITLQETFHPGK